MDNVNDEDSAPAPAYEHSWTRHGSSKAAYSSWSRCVHCRILKLYEWSPGWPGSTSFFDPDGTSEVDPSPCVKPSQPSPYS